MSVKWDVVDSLAGLSEDLKVEGNFVARIHDEVKKIRDERDALQKKVEALTSPVVLRAGEQVEPGQGVYTAVWCDGNGNLGACACGDGDRQKGHLRSSRRLSLEEVLRQVAAKQREACARQFEDEGASVSDRGNAEWVRKTPLVTEGKP